MMNRNKILGFTIIVYIGGAACVPCRPKQFDQDSVVCVCTASYCDTIEVNRKYPGNPIPYFQSYVTSRDGKRFDYKEGSWGGMSPQKYVFHIGNETKQTIMGFGGAFTDAATMNIDQLSPAARKNLIHSYFGPNGIEYTLGRIPMASCDFSTSVYSYDDHEGDFELEKFALVKEDTKHKIPAIKDAMAASTRNISLFGSPWSSPAWMKTNNNMTGKGTIKGNPGEKYYKAWAKYFVKFLNAYKREGIDIWGLTAQNEPSDGMITDFEFQCLGFTPDLQRDFIANDLGPALREGGFDHVKLMILDDVRTFLPYWAQEILKSPDAAQYVSGIAVHWYEDLFIPPVALDDTYEEFGEDYFLLATEACNEDLVNRSNAVELGSWHRAERYFLDILEDLSHGVSGWVDWNLALDMQGGPNWVQNYVDSPIIVNAEKDEFYKQPMFYAMGHFSKFVDVGARVINHTASVNPEESNVEAIFFSIYVRGGEMAVANFVNIHESDVAPISIYDEKVPFGSLIFEIPPKSFVTFTWWRE